MILIIGILAAIAIPSFLSQKSKATASQAKELARTAETTAETFSTDNNGSYKGITAPELKKYEPSILTAKNGKEAYLKEAAEVEAGIGYEVVAEGTEGATFTINATKKAKSNVPARRPKPAPAAPPLANGSQRPGLSPDRAPSHHRGAAHGPPLLLYALAPGTGARQLA